MRVSGTLLLLAALTCTYGAAQVQTEILGPPSACRNEANYIEMSYPVRLRFQNVTQGPVRVKLLNPPQLIFFLYNQKDEVDAASTVYMYNPDYFAAPPIRTRYLKAGEVLEWNEVAVIEMEGGWHGGLPEAGRYYLLPFPAIQVSGKPALDDWVGAKDRLIPLQLPQPDLNAARCKRAKYSH